MAFIAGLTAQMLISPQCRQALRRGGGEDLSSSLILGSVVGAISGLILGLIFGLIFSAVLKFMFIGAVLLGIAGAVWGFVAYVNGW